MTGIWVPVLSQYRDFRSERNGATCRNGYSRLASVGFKSVVKVPASADFGWSTYRYDLIRFVKRAFSIATETNIFEFFGMRKHSAFLI
jgi:hypothetical protein